MKVSSVLTDEKVKARSISIVISIREYLALAKKIFKKNDFQRKRVRGSKTVYSLLKTDILKGCVIPPIVLAYLSDTDLENSLEKAVTTESDHFVILDGLQRSYTLMDIELEIQNDSIELDKFLSRNIRCEIYESINRLGILYRMLTLNTGQTAMSLRHQIEIMYLDYLDTDLNGINLVRESDNKKPMKADEYSFRDVIEGFNSYIERSESPLDRGDILENISSLGNLAKENSSVDLFKDFVVYWDSFIQQIIKLEIENQNDELEMKDEFDIDATTTRRPWGVNGVAIFKRAQALSGFGAAIGMLRDDNILNSLQDLDMSKIVIGAEAEEFIFSFNKTIETINSKAKRIGNAQRLFFRQFFRMLFWEQSGTYLNLAKSHEEAYTSSLRIGI